MPTKSKSPTITKDKKRLPPVHPGEILSEEFLKPLGITQYRLAERVHVPRRRINEIVLGQRSISADTALRLARFFGTSERFWLNLQATYDLNVERDRIAENARSNSSFGTSFLSKPTVWVAKSRKSRGNRSLIESATVLLPPVRGEV